jgi:uncharacterized membrane protein YozB (DUF420 family)
LPQLTKAIQAMAITPILILFFFIIFYYHKNGGEITTFFLNGQTKSANLKIIITNSSLYIIYYKVYCYFVFDLYQETLKSGIKIESFSQKVLVGSEKVCTFAPANEETTSESTEERVL